MLYFSKRSARHTDKKEHGQYIIVAQNKAESDDTTHLLGEKVQMAYLFARIDSELDVCLRGTLADAVSLRQCFAALN